MFDLEYISKLLDLSKQVWNAIVSIHSKLNMVQELIAEASKHYYSDIDRSKHLYNTAQLLDPNSSFALKQLGHLCTREGDYHGALIWYRRYEATSIRIGSVIDNAHSKRFIGIIKRITGDINNAEKQFNFALSLYTKIGDTLGEVAIYDELGVLYRIRGKLEDAKNCFEKSISILNTLDQTEQVVKIRLSKTLSRLATIERHYKFYHSAEKKYIRALQLAKECDLKRQVAEDLLHIGMCKLGILIDSEAKSILPIICSCYLYEAEENFNESLEISKQISSRETMIKANLNHAILLRISGKYREALIQLEKCLLSNRKFKMPEGIIAVYHELSMIYCILNEYDEAERQIIKAIEECDVNGICGAKGHALAHLGNVYRLNDQCNNAKITYGEAASTFDELGQEQHRDELLKLLHKINCDK